MMTYSKFEQESLVVLFHVLVDELQMSINICGMERKGLSVK